MVRRPYRRHVISKLADTIAVKPKEWWEKRSPNDICRTLGMFVKYYVAHNELLRVVRPEIENRLKDMSSHDLHKTIVRSEVLSLLKGTLMETSSRIFTEQMRSELPSHPDRLFYLTHVVAAYDAKKIFYQEAAELLVAHVPAEYYLNLRVASTNIRYISSCLGWEKAWGFAKKQERFLLAATKDLGARDLAFQLDAIKTLFDVRFETKTLAESLETLVHSVGPKFTLPQAVEAASLLSHMNRNIPYLYRMLGGVVAHELRHHDNTEIPLAYVRSIVVGITSCSSTEYLSSVYPSLSPWLCDMCMHWDIDTATTVMQAIAGSSFKYDWDAFVFKLFEVVLEKPSSVAGPDICRLLGCAVQSKDGRGNDEFETAVVATLSKISSKKIEKFDVGSLCRLLMITGSLSERSSRATTSTVEQVVLGLNIAYNLDRSDGILRRTQPPVEHDAVMALLTDAPTEESPPVKRILFKHLLMIFDSVQKMKHHPALQKLHWVPLEIVDQIDKVATLTDIKFAIEALIATGVKRAAVDLLVNKVKSSLQYTHTETRLCHVLSAFSRIKAVQQNLTQTVMLNLENRKKVVLDGKSMSKLASYLTAARATDVRTRNILTGSNIVFTGFRTGSDLLNVLVYFTKCKHAPPDQMLSKVKGLVPKAPVEVAVKMFHHLWLFFKHRVVQHPIASELTSALNSLVGYLSGLVGSLSGTDVLLSGIACRACHVAAPFLKKLSNRLSSLDTSSCNPTMLVQLLSSFSLHRVASPGLLPVVAAVESAFWSIPQATATEAVVALAALSVRDEKFWSKVRRGLEKNHFRDAVMISKLV
eukprot:TRINITY_DN22155_c0_g1_i1.p1 TRINITY_DN22155_c0_g1~~TRINITY_DN22155_c0_g1_i1.p1  ORF type:complete len:815 (+),score=133.06 TRINITY_DN22155_c0_g1_i1:45-2489(+)